MRSHIILRNDIRNSALHDTDIPLNTVKESEELAQRRFFQFEVAKRMLRPIQPNLTPRNRAMPNDMPRRRSHGFAKVDAHDNSQLEREFEKLDVFPTLPDTFASTITVQRVYVVFHRADAFHPKRVSDVSTVQGEIDFEDAVFGATLDGREYESAHFQER